MGLKYCPVCGYANPDDTVFCQHCGSMINQTFSSSPDSTAQASIGSSIPAYDLNTTKALYSLRSSIFLVFLGMILSIIPLVDIAGGIILLIGAVKLIISLGEIGKTHLPSAPKLQRARNWLIVYFTTSIIAIILSVAFFAIIMSSLLVTVTKTGGTGVTNTTVTGITRPNFAIFSVSISFLAIFLMFLISFIAGIIFYFYLGYALSSLGDDLRNSKVSRGGKRIVTATIVFIIGMALSTVTLAGLIISIAASKGISSTSLIPTVIIVLLIITIIVEIAGYIMFLMGLYSAYSGLEKPV